MNVLKFEKSNCHPCASVQYFFDKKGIDITRVSIEEEPEKALEWQVRVVPTTILLDDSGEEVTRVTGYDFGKLSEMAKAVSAQ